MAKKKATEENNVNEDDFFANIAKASGGKLFKDAGFTSYFIDSGNFSLNYILSGKYFGGGYAAAKVTEVFGLPGSSKSLLSYCFLAGCQKMGGIAIYLDCERAGNAKFAEKAGKVDSSKLISYEPMSIEQVEAKIINSIKLIRKHKPDAPIGIVWDSLTVSPTDREIKENDLPEQYTEAQFKAIVGSKERPAERAKAVSDFCRKVTPFLDENNATLFVINQIRHKLNVMFGSPETTPGGLSLSFYASCRMRTSTTTQILDPKVKVPIGTTFKFVNKKNRHVSPGLVADGIQLYFDHGINPISGLLTSLISSKRITGAGTYTINPEFTDGEEVTFRAAKSRNTVPLDILYQYPKLIDAETADQIKNYLEPYAEAIRLSSGEDFAEATVSEKEADEDETEFSDGGHLMDQGND